MSKFYHSLFLLVSFTSFLSTSIAQNLQLEDNWWMPNGQVYAIEKDTINNIVYLGGSFNQVGPTKKYGAQVDLSSGMAAMAFAEPNGPVFCSAPDGSGGWYIGGDFTQVGDSLRNRLVHIDASGNVSAWNPSANKIVYALKVVGSFVYAGGDFTLVGNLSKKRLVQIDAISGVPTSFTVDINAPVRAIDESAGILYIGGDFTQVGLQSQYGTKIDKITGLPPSFQDLPNNTVFCSVQDGNGGWFIGGSFYLVGDSVRYSIAHLNNLGKVTSWKVQISGDRKSVV